MDGLILGAPAHTIWKDPHSELLLTASRESCILVTCSASSNGRKKETRPEWKAFSNFIYNCHSDKK